MNKRGRSQDRPHLHPIGLHETECQMAEITASLVKELREKTGAGVMDCKRALCEVQGDLERPVDCPRTKGLPAAARKAVRASAAALICVRAVANRHAAGE